MRGANQTILNGRRSSCSVDHCAARFCFSVSWKSVVCKDRRWLLLEAIWRGSRLKVKKMMVNPFAREAHVDV
ncbi:uncharacterized protein G2W53_030597 [Senna tora]|uniref:Uncharacterized protein n=1 Tax=Senna tora TaxID=362788 RepID=A0A834T7I3_9FABA|nr:uncharacterized protein G2W53_030597 [Senna tora]